MANRYCKSIQFGINGPIYIIKDEELDNQVAEHIEDFYALNVQFNALKSTVTTLSNNVNALQTKVNQNTANIGTLETALNNQGEAILTMANAISSIQSSLSSIGSDMSYMAARIEKIEKAIHVDPPEPPVNPEYSYDSVTGDLNFTNITVISDADGNIILDSDNFIGE